MMNGTVPWKGPRERDPLLLQMFIDQRHSLVTLYWIVHLLLVILYHH
jgi:hypothetical protein